MLDSINTFFVLTLIAFPSFSMVNIAKAAHLGLHQGHQGDHTQIQHGALHPTGDDHTAHIQSLHATAEDIYREAREHADRQRKALGPNAFAAGGVTDLGQYQRVWDFFYPDYNCPLMKERIGRIGDGGKWVCGLRYLLQGRSCLAYSLGSAGDTSFELEVLNKTSCEVHTFDHTLSKEVQEAVANTPSVNFHPIGIGSPSRGSGLHTLEQIMTDLGHEWVDLLKIDIEGSEWDLFKDFYATEGASLPATQILVEFHFKALSTVWQTFDKLLADNFRVFAVEPNYYCDDGCCAKNLVEFALVKVSPSGHICAPHTDETTGEDFLPRGCRAGNQ